MGDGIQNRYALIINGDAAEHHLRNVEASIRALRAEAKYQISAASTQKPTQKVDHFVLADSKGLDSLIRGMNSQLDDDDLLVVYVTGHGDKGSHEEGCAILSDQCYSLAQLQEKLQALSYGKRIIVMDQCYSGAGLLLFADPRTTVITAGSPGEEVSCQLFSPYFWSTHVPDQNGDKVITLQERYAFALSQSTRFASLTQFYEPATSISFSGKKEKNPPFKPSVIEVHDDKSLSEQLKKLKPGQLALVTFSADWCKPCQEYKPKFRSLSQKYGGRFLMLLAEGKEGSEKDWGNYGVKSFPKVAFIDQNGKVTFVENRIDPLGSQAMTVVYESKARITFYLRLLKSKNPIDRVRGIEHLGQMGEDAVSTIPDLINLLGDKVPKVRSAAAETLGRMGEKADPAVPALVKLLNDKDQRVYSSAFVALYAIGEKVVSYLVKLLKDSDPNIRGFSAWALCHMRDKAASALPDLVKLLKDQDFWVRDSAAQTFGYIGEAVVSAIPDLAKLLRNEDAEVRSSAAKALGHIRERAVSAVPDLEELLRDQNPKVRTAAAWALEQIRGTIK